MFCVVLGCGLSWDQSSVESGCYYVVNVYSSCNSIQKKKLQKDLEEKKYFSDGEWCLAF